MLFARWEKWWLNPKILTCFMFGLECFGILSGGKQDGSVDLGNWSFNFGGFKSQFFNSFHVGL